MAISFYDRVKETSATTGLTSIALGGAVTQFRSFSSVYSNAIQAYYCAADQSGPNWEVGIGTYLSSGNVLGRTSILASSNSGNIVNFTSGALFVFGTIPAIACTSTKPGQLLGTPTNDSAIAGNVGEIITASLASGSAINLPSAMATNVTSISLTAGDWDVWGNVVIIGSSAIGQTNFAAWINTVSATAPTLPYGAINNLSTASVSGDNQILPTGMTNINVPLGSTTTVYLTAYAAFTSGSETTYGIITARRRR